MYKKAFWISLIFLGCFFLNGCGGIPAAEQSSFSFESASLPGDFPSASSFHSLSEQESIILKTYERLSKENLSYEEYFSQERYWETDGWGYALFEYRSDENAIYQKELDGTLRLFYAHDKPIDRLYWDNRYLFYFLSDHCIYRIFVPDCKVEKIYENPQMSGFSPLSNYAVLFAVPNPENEGKNSETDPSEPPDYFIYHAGKDSQWPLNPEEIGLDSIGGSITRSAREIYQIPAQ